MPINNRASLGHMHTSEKKDVALKHPTLENHQACVSEGNWVPVTEERRINAKWQKQTNKKTITIHCRYPALYRLGKTYSEG